QRVMSRVHPTGPVALMVLLAGVLLTQAGGGPAPHPPQTVRPPRVAGLPNNPILIGCWRNIVKSAGVLLLGAGSSHTFLVDIAFGLRVSGSTSTIGFTVDSPEGEPQFIADVAALHSKGKAVLLSIGGASGIVQLTTSADVQNFVSSVASIVNKFGFDGIDIDFKGSSVTLNAGGTGFKNPTTPAIVNLISALRQLKSTFGADFIISMAPETFFVQAGFRGYGGQQGAYLPVIFGTRDVLSFVHVQDYNTGTRV